LRRARSGRPRRVSAQDLIAPAAQEQHHWRTRERAVARSLARRRSIIYGRHRPRLRFRTLR
jgi:hypothetical protein